MSASLARIGFAVAACALALTATATPATATPATATPATAAPATAATAALAAAPARPDVSAQAIVPDGYYPIRNANSGKCLQAGTRQGRVVSQFQCSSFNDLQRWHLRSISGDTYEIRNFQTGQCLAIGEGSVADGPGAITWQCLGSPEQRWNIAGNSGGYTVVNANSSKCLAIGSAATGDGAWAIQWTCFGSIEQNWLLF